MAKLSIKPGSTSVTLIVFIQDSSSTVGAGRTALAYDTASLTCYYVRPGSAAASLSLVTQTVTGAHSAGGFVKIDDTNMPGVYRLDLHNDIVATGVRSAVVMLKGASNMVPLVLEIDLNAETNVTHWLGTACAAPTTNGVPEVDVTHWGGTAIASAYVQANTVQFAGQTITCAGGVTIPAATLASTTGAVGSVTAGVTLANGAHGGASASLTLGAGASISNASGSALTLSSSGGNGSGLVCTGNGTGKGIAATGGTSGAGIAAVGGATANGYGIYAEANSADCYGLQAVGKGATESGGIKGVANTSGEGIEGLAAGNGHGLYVVGAGTGEGIHATAGGGANGHGAHFEGVGANSHGLLLSRGGAGGDDLSFANNDVTVATVTSVTGIGTGGIAAASFAAGAINAAAIATGAIDADAIADNAIDAGAIATGAITAAKFAASAIDAAAFAPDAGTEIGTAVWASAARTLTAATNVTSTGGAVPITAGGYVSADVKAINAVIVDGAGTGGDPWGPA